ncbi:MAG TPA: hypothetical protein VJ301_16615 [Propionibacteriaceae bacterium]|nr:hypothetical protein [Propionibacteriaceae bacterium]
MTLTPLSGWWVIAAELPCPSVISSLAWFPADQALVHGESLLLLRIRRRELRRVDGEVNLSSCHRVQTGLH